MKIFEHERMREREHLCVLCSKITKRNMEHEGIEYKVIKFFNVLVVIKNFKSFVTPAKISLKSQCQRLHEINPKSN